MKKSLWIVLSLLLSNLSLPVCAQKTSTPQPPSNITRPDSLADSGFYGYWTNMTGQGRAGGALLGKLNIEGEPLLWNPVLISVICKGETVYTTQTDPKGNFAIASVKVVGNLSQQSDEQRQMETHFEGCTVQGEFAGFHSNSITISVRNLRDDPNLGTLTLSRAGGRDAGTAFSDTIQSAPAAAVKSFEKARNELLEQKPDRAQHDLEKAVQIYPSFAEAWYQLGRLQAPSSSSDARNSFSKAVAADPQFVLPYEQLASLASQNGKWQETVDNTSHALQLNPTGTPQIWYLNALGNFQLDKAAIAEESAKKSLAMDPSHLVPNTEQLLAVILAKKGDYKGALEHLHNCLTYLPSGANADLIKQQIAQLEHKTAAAK